MVIYNTFIKGMIKVKAIVFGGTGFIGSHTVERLRLKGHEVTAVVRQTSDTSFLDSLGVRVVKVDFSKTESLGEIIKGHQTVYNCTADANLSTKVNLEAPVEIGLTRELLKQGALNGVERFIQLSSIVVYDFRTNKPITESYDIRPEYPIQELLLKREEIVQEIGKETDMVTIILRPASAIGPRDKASFFSRLLKNHVDNKFPFLKNGQTIVSLVDTRDIGRAMEWLGTYKMFTKKQNMFLLKGFDTTWGSLKAAIDEARGTVANVHDLSKIVEENTSMSYALSTFSTNRIWDDEKIRSLGFKTKYSQTESVQYAVRDLIKRNFI
ncbi:NAD-dependent epimerase/dehydratase family protein [Priestia megaterium]|uniref:NAD-dependent epimerase/dehydratase family protein n=2 Tax=Priestia megaterium TaxID=1404 RepID=UPI0030080C49